jgi:hypothetical protein
MTQARIFGILLLMPMLLLMLMTACGRKLEGTATLDNKNTAPATAPSSSLSAAQII